MSTIIAYAAVIIALFMGFKAPAAVNVGTVQLQWAQRIIYFHVPVAWVFMLSFTVSFVASIVFLITKKRIWDLVALAGVELGLTFATAAVISGSIWARPAWNTWWTWDPRLTTMAITWLLYVAYFMLRGAVEEPERQARFAAVYSIFSYISVPITFFSIRLARTIHPLLVKGNDFGLAKGMRPAFFAGLIAFTLLYIVLLWHRLRVLQLASRVEALRARILEQEL